jgi:hypothetical protein
VRTREGQFNWSDIYERVTVVEKKRFSHPVS